MSLLVQVLRAAHCHNTHHRFAIDALAEVRSTSGRRLSQMLLRHYSRYLEGSKAPDTSFRDFKNHVIHVEQQNWGGAPVLASHWYQRAIESIVSRNWNEASYAMGVLSHYFTDPLMPLHTGQSDREAIYHRPLEWSVYCAYDRIYEKYQQGDYRITFQFAQKPDFLRDAMLTAAEIAHEQYDVLLNGYDLSLGAKSPAEALSSESIDCLAMLFGLTLHGWARLIERVAEQAAVEIPKMDLTLTTLLAGIDVPLQSIVRKFKNSKERAAVQSLIQEFQRTGQVTENLPDEVKVVREERKSDLLLSPSSDPSSQPTPDLAKLPNERMETEEVPTIKMSLAGQPKAVAIPPANDTDESPVLLPFAEAQEIKSTNRNGIERRLHHDSPIVDAPSIGPKTAARLQEHGIQTVGDFLDWNSAVLSIRLKVDWITPSVLQEWKDQSRLMCGLADLNATDSKLLVAAGCTDVEQLASAEPTELLVQILVVCDSSAGERILRGASHPDLAKVKRWIAAAATVSAPQNSPSLPKRCSPFSLSR